MILYCQKNDCEVTVILAPIPVTSIFSMPRYHSYSGKLKELVEQSGASFYDLNFAKKELYDPQLDDFYDATHTNEKGGTRATEAICRILQMEEAGEDTASLFYDTWESYLESIDYAAAVYMNVEENDSDISATAYCVTGTKIIPEFKFVLHNMENDSEEVIHDFSTGNIVSVPKEQLSKDSIVLRVYARAAGEENEQYIRYSDYQVEK